MESFRLAQRRSCACLLLLIAAIAVSLPAGSVAQTDACPSLTLSNTPKATDLKNAVIQACRTNSSFQATPATCGPCQCALVAAVAPLLQDAGVILSTEMYTANAVLSITQSIRNCSREFALQLLESESGLKLSQLLSLDTCTPDDKITTQCMSQPGSASGTAANASASGNATVGVSATDGSNALNELMRDASCALAASGNRSADDCAAHTPATSSWIIMAPVNTDASTQGLKISSKTTRGPIAWRAGCWCDESYDPVCNPVTRKQYPNPCSAKCQFVAQTVPCSDLAPLVRQGQLPGASASTVYVYDQSMKNPTAAAFSGPVPPAAPLEADEDTQLFYYYYDDDVDDTQEALDITTGFYKAMTAAKYGDDSSNAAAIAKSVSAALKVAAQTATANKPSVQGQDGLADNRTVAASTNSTGFALLDNLRNRTRPIEVIARLRGRTANSGSLFRNETANVLEGAANATEAARSTVMNATQAARNAYLNASSAAAERRTIINTADQPAMPSWISTETPGQSAAIYTRNPQRTSRILSALQAASKQAGQQQQAAGVVVQLGPGLQGVIDGVQQAVRSQALEQTPAAPLAGGLFRGAMNSTETFMNTTGSFRPGNGTILKALNSTLANATAAMTNGTTVRPFDITAFSDMLQRLDNVSAVQDSMSKPSAANSTSSHGNSTDFAAFRQAIGTNSSLVANSSVAANSTQYQAHNSTVTVKATSSTKQKIGRRLLNML